VPRLARRRSSSARAVNSLGLGGTNAFVVLEEPPAPAETAGADVTPLHLLALSAKTEAALRASIERHHAWLEANTDAPLADLCLPSPAAARIFPSACRGGRSIAQLRRALAERLESPPALGPASAGGKRQLAFLFSGQGSHTLNGGRTLSTPAGISRGR
jgi:acyl transferase domain-containing protein